MRLHYGMVSLFFSIWVASFMIQGAVLLKDIDILDCRITGVTVATDKNKINFNFAEAQSVCQQMGLTLAQKSQIETAWKHGFETCSFGWVAEGYAVISRIIANEKCGQNKTGIAIWRIAQTKKARAYCYNSSDTWINSCVPEESTVTLPDNSTEMNFTSTASQDTLTAVQTTQLPQMPKSWKYRIICVTETLTPEPTTVKEIQLFTDKRTAFKNESVRFGAIPTVLLVLALFFFAAAVILAICYIKKYKKTSLFSNKKEKKDEIETKNIKEINAKGQTSEHDPKSRKKEEPEAKHEPPVRCLEAEV